MDDLISRKALLEELDKWINPCVNYDKSEIRMVICAMPYTKN